MSSIRNGKESWELWGNGRDDFMGELWSDLGELRVFETVGE